MILSSLDLNLLLVLDTVLSERSVARAAKRLHVTPSAISNSLAKLRVALGDPLVTREGRGIVPTPRATELQPALARAIAELERVVTQGAFDRSRVTAPSLWPWPMAGKLLGYPRSRLGSSKPCRTRSCAWLASSR